MKTHELAARLDQVAKEMEDAPFDYAELVGDWRETIKDVAFRLRLPMTQDEATEYLAGIKYRR